MSLDSSTGIRSGTPNVAGNYAYTIAASDVDAAQAGRAFTMKVIDPSIVDPPTQFQMSVGKTGSGTGAVVGNGIDCGANCAVLLDGGTAVLLSATPNSGNVFDGWSGACSGTGTCDLTMDAAKNVTATFVPLTYTLTVASSGPANAGAVTSIPASMNCGGHCEQAYAPGATVTLSTTSIKRRHRDGPGSKRHS